MNILYFHLISFFILSFIFLGVIRNNFTKKVFIILITIQCTIIVGLRDITVGVDTLRYSIHFSKTLEDISYALGKSDIGYFLLQKVIGTIFLGDFSFWLVFVSLMIYVPLGVIIYKYSQNIFLSYLIYFSFEFFFFNFSGIRQSLALSGILISYYFIINKKPWKFIILILLSASFHNTALVFLPAYWLAQKKITKSYLLCLLGFFIIMYIMKYRIGEILTNLYYDDSQHVIGLYESSTGIGGTAVFIILVLLLGFIFYNASTFSAIIENRVLTNIMIIALMIQLLSSFSYLFTRLNLYYFIFIILYLPYVVSKIGRGNIKMKIKEAFLVKGVISIIFIFFLQVFIFPKFFKVWIEFYHTSSFGINFTFTGITIAKG